MRGRSTDTYDQEVVMAVRSLQLGDQGRVLSLRGVTLKLRLG